jgi:hypothetical protein
MGEEDVLTSNGPPETKVKKKMSSEKICPFWATNTVYAHGFLSWDIGMRTIALSMLQ